MITFSTLEQYLDLTYEYDQITRLVRDFGRRWEWAELPADVGAGELRRCFPQARALAIAQPTRFTYVEGYACNRTPCPIHHAWCVDERGFVVDPTWVVTENASYFGIAFEAEILRCTTVDFEGWGLLRTPMFSEKLIVTPERYLQLGVFSG